MSSDQNKPRHDHERSDWDLRYVLWGATFLVLFVGVTLPVLWWIFREFESLAENRQMGTAHVTEQQNIPPQPRLQVSPQDDWEDMLRQEQAILNSYRWVDRSRRIVHIPISRAMELIAERGLPGVEGERR